MNKLLSINHLKKNYHDKKKEIVAINDISFDVCDNDFLSIVGPSGCGKSTLLSILANLEKKTSGSIKLYKDDLKIGYMLQDDCLFPWLNILDNCLIGLRINNSLDEKSRQYVTSLLEKYGLKDFINSYPDSLSGGMRQRVALIRTLATNPDILLLDEPFSALDYQSRLKLSNEIYKIIKNEKKTAIMVTHDLGEAISMSSRVIVLSKRPAIIKNIYEINLDDLTTPTERRKSKNFTDYYDAIWGMLDDYI